MLRRIARLPPAGESRGRGNREADPEKKTRSSVLQDRAGRAAVSSFAIRVAANGSLFRAGSPAKVIVQHGEV